MSKLPKAEKELSEFFNEINETLKKSFNEITKIQKKANRAEFQVIEMNHSKLNDPVSFYYLRVNILPVFTELINYNISQNLIFRKVIEKFQEYIKSEL